MFYDEFSDYKIYMQSDDCSGMKSRYTFFKRFIRRNKVSLASVLIVAVISTILYFRMESYVHHFGLNGVNEARISEESVVLDFEEIQNIAEDKEVKKAPDIDEVRQVAKIPDVQEIQVSTYYFETLKEKLRMKAPTGRRDSVSRLQ